MARAKVTTIRLDAEDVAALGRARRDGIAATELVRRGLRVVGARYYAQQASRGLGPVDPNTPAARAWQRERAAFERLTTKAHRRYEGSWVAVLGGKVVAHHDDYETVVRRGKACARRRPFFVGRVGHAPAVVEMPGFDLEP